MTRILKICLTLILSLVLTGCFHFSEDIWVGSDASGRIKFDVAVTEKLVGSIESLSKYGNEAENADVSEPKPLVNLEAIKQNLETNSYIKKLKIQEYSDAGLRHYMVDARVKDFHQLPEVEQIILSSFNDNNEVEQETPSPSFAFIGNDPKNMVFEQNLNTQVDKVATKTELKQSNKATDAIMGTFFNLLFSEEYNYITLHAAHIDDANGLINDEETLVKWSIPLNKLSSTGTLKAEFSYR